MRAETTRAHVPHPDLAPVILSYLGVENPASMNPPAREAEAEGEKLIQDRLSGLGYI